MDDSWGILLCHPGHAGCNRAGSCISCSCPLTNRETFLGLKRRDVRMTGNDDIEDYGLFPHVDYERAEACLAMSAPIVSSISCMCHGSFGVKNMLLNVEESIPLGQC